MTHRTDQPDDSAVAAMRLPDLLQMLTLTRPVMATALEQFIRTILIDEQRQAMASRLARLTSDDMTVMDTLMKQFERVRDLERQRFESK